MYQMTLLDPSITVTPIYHRHYWRLYIVTDGKDDDIIARCDCGEEMTKGQVEVILNGERFLTDD